MSTQRICAVLAAACLAGLTAPALAQSPSGIPGVVAPGVEPQLVQEGFKFTEGPVGNAEGALYFSDIRTNRTYLLETGGKISVARENTNGDRRGNHREPSPSRDQCRRGSPADR